MSFGRLPGLGSAMSLPFIGADRAASERDDELLAWVDKLPIDSPIIACRMLEDRLKAVLVGNASLRHRLRHLEILEHGLPALLQRLESTLANTTQPLATPQRSLAASVLKLLKRFAAGYLSLASEMSNRWMSAGFARPRETALRRAARAVTIRIELAHRAYANPSANCWRQLLEIHLLARRDEFLETTDPDSPAESIASLHARALLTTLADPGRLTNAQIDHVCFYLKRHATLVSFVAPSTLSSQQRNQTGLFVIESNGRPARPLWHGTRPGPQAVIMDARPLLRRLQRQIDALAQGAEPGRIGLHANAASPAYRSLLHSLVQKWQLPRARRHPRARFLPRADLVAGFEQIRRFLGDAAFARRAGESDNRTDAGESPGEWAITDESPGGFGLRYLGRSASALRVADVCALRPRERSLVHLCVVRRAVNLGEREFDIGVEVLAAQGVSTTLNLPAETIGEPRTSVDVILLPRVPALARQAAILAPVGAVRANSELLVHWHGRKWRFVTADAVEHFDSCELVPLRLLQDKAPG